MSFGSFDFNKFDMNNTSQPKVSEPEMDSEPDSVNISDALAMVRANAHAGEKKDALDKDMASGGIGYRRPVTHTDTKAQTKKNGTPSQKGTCEIRSFPKSLLLMAKSNFPEAPNTKALAAFVYAHRDTTLDIDYSDVPQDVIELAQKIDIYKAMMQTDKNIRHINESLKRLNEASDDIVLAVSYLIYDRLGFRTDNPERPGDVNFMEQGVDELTSHLEEISDKLRKERKYQEGRPIT